MIKGTEIFYSIQGEGPYSGRPAVFIRLAECQLKCVWRDTAGTLIGKCDTDFLVNWEKCAPTIANEVDKLFPVSLAKTNQCRLVVITGGEPLIQEITPLFIELLDKFYEVQIETSGKVSSKRSSEYFNSRVKYVVSPKTKKINRKIGEYAQAWKYVVAPGMVSSDDGLPCVSPQDGKLVDLARPLNRAPIYVQPLGSDDPMESIKNQEFAADLAMKYGYRLSVQLHKIIGVQ